MAAVVSSDLFKEAQEQSEEELERQSIPVRWKLDLIIVPMVGITHGFQFLDKSSLSIASAYNLRQDLGLTLNQFSWAGAVFNFGFMSWSLPANYLLQRLPIAKVTGTHLLLWGLLMMLHASAFNYGSLVTVRFFLGMAEAGLAPAPLYFMSMFYTRREMPLRMCLALSFNGLAYIASALMGYGLGHVTNAAVPPWKLIYLVYGSLNFVWGILFLSIMPDEPAKARFLSHQQKIVAAWRVAKNMVGFKEPHFKISQVYEALRDPKVLVIILMGLGIGTPLGGVTTFMSTIIEGFGFSGIEAIKWQLPIGAVAFVGIVACGGFATLVPNTRCITIIVISLAPFGCLLGLRFLPRDDRWTLLGCSWTQLLALADNCLTWALITANMAGHTKRTIVSGLFFTFFAAGNIVGNKIFFADQAPRYYSAIDGFLVCYAGIMVLAAMLGVMMYLDNRSRRRRLYVAAGETQQEKLEKEQDERDAILSGLKDQTDQESVNFRYTY